MQLEEHYDETFENRKVILDNKDFQRSRFNECTLVYKGGHLRFENNQVTDCNIELDGAAARTVQFIGGIQADTEDPEAFLEHIREMIQRQ